MISVQIFCSTHIKWIVMCSNSSNPLLLQDCIKLGIIIMKWGNPIHQQERDDIVFFSLLNLPSLDEYSLVLQSCATDGNILSVEECRVSQIGLAQFILVRSVHWESRSNTHSIIHIIYIYIYIQCVYIYTYTVYVYIYIY